MAHLQGAGERVGFIYPNVQYFGNRNDFFQAPEYNLYGLLRGPAALPSTGSPRRGGASAWSSPAGRAWWARMPRV